MQLGWSSQFRLQQRETDPSFRSRSSGGRGGRRPPPAWAPKLASLAAFAIRFVVPGCLNLCMFCPGIARLQSLESSGYEATCLLWVKLVTHTTHGRDGVEADDISRPDQETCRAPARNIVLLFECRIFMHARWGQTPPIYYNVRMVVLANISVLCSTGHRIKWRKCSELDREAT